VLEQATTINPLDPDCWMLLADCYNKVENFDYALDSVKQALKLAPNNLNILLSATEIALQMEDKQLPDQLVTRALNLPNQNIDQIIRISNLLIALDRIEDAARYLDVKIDLAVDQVALQIQRAKLVGLTQGSKQKLELLIGLAKDNPKNPLIFAHLTDSYIETKNSDEAIRAAQFALKYAGNSLDIPQLTKLHFQLGVLLRQAGQLDQALHQLTQSIRLSPNFLAARLEIGETLTKRKEYVQALEHFQKAIEIAPRDPRPYKEAGLLLKESKDYVGAEAMFRQAYALDSNDIFTQRQLATVIALALIHQPNTNRFSHGKSK
jgi:tetratricopeptide (TPR) repeat protein